MSTQDIVVPNQFATIQNRLANLLDLRTKKSAENPISVMPVMGSSCSFGTILFPYSSDIIDGALAQVILQVVGGHSYIEAILAETIRSLDYVREVRRGTMRGAPHLLQIWLLAHIRPFCSSHPFSCITDECSLIIRLLMYFDLPTVTTPIRGEWKKRYEPCKRMRLAPTLVMATVASSQACDCPRRSRSQSLRLTRDSLTGSALDWFMSLKAEDILTWADLSRRFIDQY
ncbi:hypothetical protein CRG98_011358 [Punica granatum]|uniref:DUF7745 domain-containing protein n=1 Tax=Punica granatum TaxID=22663 RepID=A0A2I0KI72_PUNGR|nr:hypothetical protein CRG98_011358 [Punica granatum]